MHVAFYLNLLTNRILAVTYSYFDLIITEEITYLSYYMKGNMAGMNQNLFSSNENFKEKNRKRIHMPLLCVTLKKSAMFR